MRDNVQHCLSARKSLEAIGRGAHIVRERQVLAEFGPCRLGAFAYNGAIASFGERGQPVDLRGRREAATDTLECDVETVVPVARGRQHQVGDAGPDTLTLHATGRATRAIAAVR